MAVYKGLSGRKIIKMKMHLGKTISLPGTGDAHTSMTLVLEYQFGVYKIRMIFEIEDEYIRPTLLCEVTIDFIGKCWLTPTLVPGTL